MRDQALPADAQREDGGLLVGLHLVQPFRVGKRLGRAVGIALPLQDLPDAQVRLGRLRLDGNRLPELRQRRVLVPALLQDGAEHVVRLCVPRLCRQRGAELLDRVGQSPRLPQDDAQRVVRVGEPRSEADGFAQCALGALEIVLLLEGRPQVVERLGVGGVVTCQRLEHGYRVLEVRLLHQGRGQVEPADRVVRVRRRQRLEGGDGLLGIAPLHVGQSERVQRVEAGRVQRGRALQGSNGVIHPAALPERHAEPRERHAKRGVHGGRGPQMINRLVQMPAIAKHDAQVVLGIGAARIDGYRRLERPEGGFRVVPQPLGDAQVILRVEELRRERDGLAEVVGRLIDLPLLAEHEAEAVVRFRHPPVACQRPGVLAEGAGKVLALLENETEAVVRRGQVGVAGQGRGELRRRLVEPALLEQATAVGDLLLRGCGGGTTGMTAVLGRGTACTQRDDAGKSRHDELHRWILTRLLRRR